MAPTATLLTTAPATVRVVVLKPIFEQATEYRPDEEFSTTPERATQLEKLGLVAIIPANAHPRCPKVQAAREEVRKIGEEATARSRERITIQEEVKRAEAKVGALQTALNAAEGLEAVRQAQDILAEAQRDLEAQRALLANVTQRTEEAAARAQGARKRLEDLGGRAMQLKASALPAAEQHLADCQREHERMLRNAAAYFEGRLKPAEAELGKLQVELAGLEG